MSVTVRRSNIQVSVSDSTVLELILSRRPDALTLCFDQGSVISSQDLEHQTTMVAMHGVETFIGVIGRELESRIYEQLLAGTRGIVLAGVDLVSEVGEADRMLRNYELSLDIEVGSLEIILRIDSARGAWDVGDLIKTSDRIRQVVLDEAALCADLGLGPFFDLDACAFARGRVIVEAIAAGVQPIAYPCSASGWWHATEPNEVRGFSRSLKDLGCKGMLCTDLNWIESINLGFSPTTEEVESCLKIREVFAEAIANGKAAVGINGRMIDVPVDEWARSVLEYADAATKRDEGKPQ